MEYLKWIKSILIYGKDPSTHRGAGHPVWFQSLLFYWTGLRVENVCLLACLKMVTLRWQGLTCGTLQWSKYSFTIKDHFHFFPLCPSLKKKYPENLPETFILHLGPQSPKQHPLWEAKCVILWNSFVKALSDDVFGRAWVICQTYYTINLPLRCRLWHEIWTCVRLLHSRFKSPLKINITNANFLHSFPDLQNFKFLIQFLRRLGLWHAQIPVKTNFIYFFLFIYF